MFLTAAWNNQAAISNGSSPPPLVAPLIALQGCISHSLVWPIAFGAAECVAATMMLLGLTRILQPRF